MSKTVIVVDRGRITSNAKENRNDPVIVVRQGLNRTYAHGVNILSPDGSIAAKVVYNPVKEQDAGSKAWIETDLEVELYNSENR